MLKTIQPVTNLQNYNKNITPVLKANHTVTLTKNGQIYGTILPPKQAEEYTNNQRFMTHLFMHYVHKISKEKSYSLDQAEKIIERKM